MSLFGRKSRPARRRTNQPAWMTVDGGFAARPCTVIETGVGVSWVSPAMGPF